MELSWPYFALHWKDDPLIQISFSHDQKMKTHRVMQTKRRRKKKKTVAKSCPRCFSTPTIHKSTKIQYLWCSHLECQFYLFFFFFFFPLHVFFFFLFLSFVLFYILYILFGWKFRTRARTRGAFYSVTSFTLWNQSQDRPKDTKKRPKKNE